MKESGQPHSGSQRKSAAPGLTAEAEAALRVFDALDLPVYVINVETYVIELANPAAMALGNLHLGETACYALTHQRNTPCDGPHPCPLQPVRESGQPTRVEHVHYNASGEAFPVEVHGVPLFSESGRLSHMIEYSLDMTDRYNMEAELRVAHEVFNHTREGMLVADAAGKIVRVNRAFTRLTGYEPSEAVGKKPGTVVGSGRHDQAFFRNLWSNLLEKGFWEGEIWNRRKNGEIYPEWESISSVCDERGAPQYFVAVFRDISEQKQLEAELEWQATHDGLTRTHNRHHFEKILEQEQCRSARYGTPLSVVMFDIDRFKRINDTYGHETGDRVLKALATRVQTTLRESDIFARWGGEEFVILLPHSEPHAAEKMAERLRRTISETPCEEVGEVTISIGVATMGAGEPLTDLLRRVDEALYRAKAGGRNRVETAQPAFNGERSAAR